MEKHKVSVSDDYAYLAAGRFSFYFGYESTVCPDHGKDTHCECGKEEWAFVAYKRGKEIGRIPASKVDVNRGNMAEALLCGISRFGNKFWR